MDLKIKDIQLEDFRNYASFHMEDVGDLTIFVGPNASGKTNIVEGIQLLTAFGSFRNPRGQELIRWGADFARLRARIASDVRDVEVASIIQPGQRSHLFNGKKKPLQEMQGLLPSVAFSPDDLSLVKGSQQIRRAALDLLGCQLSRNHRVIKRDYEKIIRHKNALLRDDAPAMLVDAVNDMLVEAAAELFRYRVALFANLSSRLAVTYSGISCGVESVRMEYIPSWCSDREWREDVSRETSLSKEDVKQRLIQTLEARRSEEIARKRAVVGPHADHVEFFVDDRNASTFASQGQQRSLVLAWKIAEVGLIREITGVKPVLLLDDVMSELDAHRRHALVELLRQDIQTFITTTDAAFLDQDVVERARLVDLAGLKNGALHVDGVALQTAAAKEKCQ